MRRSAAAAFAATLAAIEPVAAEPSLAEAEARLAAVNALARAHYAQARDAALAAAGPVIVVEPERITLRRDAGSVSEATTASASRRSR